MSVEIREESGRRKWNLDERGRMVEVINSKGKVIKHNTIIEEQYVNAFKNLHGFTEDVIKKLKMIKKDPSTPPKYILWAMMII